MDKVIAAILLLLLSATASFAQCSVVTNCPLATTPLSSNDFLYVVQGGVSKKTPATDFNNATNVIYTTPGGTVTNVAAVLNTMIGAGQQPGLALKSANNLSDVASASAAVANLGLSAVIIPIPNFLTGNTPAANTAALAAAISNACAAGGGWILLPPGQFNVLAADTQVPCYGVWITGSGFQATTLLFTSGGGNANFLHWIAPSGQIYSGYGGLQNIRLYRTDNPSAGAAVYLDWGSTVFINQVEIDGFWAAIDCLSCVNNHWAHVVIEGGNSSSDSRYLWLHRNEYTLTTSASTASGAVLPFTDTTGVHPGQTVSGTNIYAGSTVLSFVPNTSVTLDHAITGTVANGASITFVGITTSENVATDPNWRSSVSGSGAYKYGIVANSFDGFTTIEGHVGFTRDAAMLFQAGNLDDAVDGFSCTGTTVDNSAIGVYFKNTASASYTDHHGYHNLSGCQIENMSQNAILADDTLLYEVGLGGITVLETGQDGIKLLAGRQYSIDGVITGSNNTGSTYSDIVINGASNVVVTGVTFGKSIVVGSSSQPAHHVLVAGSSDYLTIGPNNYRDASGTDVSLTGSGTNINLYGGSSDRTDVIAYQPTGHWSFGVFPIDTAATSHWWIGNYDMTLAGADRGILGNLYYSSGWKYAANGTGAAFVFAPDSTHAMQCFFAPNNASGGAGADATVNEWCSVDASGNLTLDGVTTLKPKLVTAAGATILAITCDGALEGLMYAVTDATSTTFNAALVGGGANHMIAYCNGSSWVVH